jgi:hypothetical protein
MHLYDVAAQEEVPLEDGSASATVTLARLRLGTPPTPPEAFTRRQHIAAAWRDGLALRSIALPGEATAAGAELPLLLTWEATAQPGADYTFFVHLLDPAGNILSQVDSQPFGGRFPTATWQRDESYSDTFHLMVPAGTPAGRYDLRVGWYTPAGPLSLEDGSGNYIVLDDLIEVR